MAQDVHISTSGVTNTVGTILSLLQRLSPEVAALPEVIGLIEAAISVFSNEDKHAVQQAYKAKMAKTDADHEETQAELGAKGSEGDPAESSSAKGGGVVDAGGSGAQGLPND